ncbi:MAG: hypothetical protein DHS20C11_28250 [Lysobacteraceae bacterium]|nr:MAG: hypothetical protein DHS20C11_28250 [Xanthomonadaceae bacterium]
MIANCPAGQSHIRIDQSFPSDCRADLLLEFLHSFCCERLYLVGDIVDLWAMKRSVSWPQTHTNVVRSILGKAKHGTRVVYIPGNHDAFLREYCGQQFGNVSLRRKVVHKTVDGKRILVIHGDAFDGAVRCNQALERIGDALYSFILRLNGWLHRARKHYGHHYWSLAGFIKTRIGNARRYIERYEEAAASAAANSGMDGIICGHIHHPNDRTIAGVQYINDGDWVESCTALVEHHDGRLQLIRWPFTTELPTYIAASKMAA